MAPGLVFWITGLSGSGKTTLSLEVDRLLRALTPAVVRLDGDTFREVFGNDLGYSPDDRLRNARRISRMCGLLADQGIHVVCATMSLFRECHVWNRAHIPGYVEVLVRVSSETLRVRDHKGLVSDAAASRRTDVVGYHQSYDEPETPDRVVTNEGTVADLNRIAAEIVSAAWSMHR